MGETKKSNEELLIHIKDILAENFEQDYEEIDNSIIKNNCIIGKQYFVALWENQAVSIAFNDELLPTKELLELSCEALWLLRDLLELEVEVVPWQEEYYYSILEKVFERMVEADFDVDFDGDEITSPYFEIYDNYKKEEDGIMISFNEELATESMIEVAYEVMDFLRGELGVDVEIDDGYECGVCSCCECCANNQNEEVKGE